MKRIIIPLCCLLSAGSLYSADEAGDGHALFGGDAAAPEPATAMGDQRMRGKQRDQNRGAMNAEMIQALFNKLDSNGDGKITSDEFAQLPTASKTVAEEQRAAKEAERLAQFDTDGDGTISDKEKKAIMEARQQEQFSQRMDQLKTQNPEKFAELDTNGDGNIDQDEQATMQANMLDRINAKAQENPELLKRFDSNKDGSIDMQEFMKSRMEQRKRGERGAGQDKDRRKQQQERKARKQKE